MPNKSQLLQQPKQLKNAVVKPKKDEPSSKSAVNHNNNNQKDEFTDWCYRTLSNITAEVDSKFY